MIVGLYSVEEKFVISRGEQLSAFEGSRQQVLTFHIIGQERTRHKDVENRDLYNTLKHECEIFAAWLRMQEIGKACSDNLNRAKCKASTNLMVKLGSSTFSLSAGS